MRKLMSVWAPVLVAVVVGMSVLAQSTREYPIRPVPFTKVHFEGGFWAERAEVNQLR